ncbi:hypothetical protein NM04_09215 [Massilia aurea]|uniref:Uncharacterized protein n=1 Tax=Massilia aurea TaxID=373040 RepID=A0A422QM47_9BURK|nr:hypothetical protein NM04_09215 [Massilia aurea]
MLLLANGCLRGSRPPTAVTLARDLLPVGASVVAAASVAAAGAPLADCPSAVASVTGASAAVVAAVSGA